MIYFSFYFFHHIPSGSEVYIRSISDHDLILTKLLKWSVLGDTSVTQCYGRVRCDTAWCYGST